MDITKLLNEKNIYFINKTDKVSVITELAAKSLACGKISDPDDFYQALVERENLMSTGIGLGVAIPHAKLSSIKDYFITVGILKQPVEWDAIDKQPVKIVFLIGGPSESQATYLQILAQLMLVIKNESLLNKLKAAQHPSEIIKVFFELV